MMHDRLSAVGYGALFAAAAAAPFLTGVYGQGVLLQLYCWIALTASWSAFSGMTGYISLGHAVFYGLGGYLLALTWGGAPMGVILVVSAAAAALLALILGLPSLRVRGPYFVILTFGLAEFAKYVIVAIESALGSSGRLLMDAPSTLTLCLAMLVLAVLGVALLIWLNRSKLGVALRAVREDEVAAATLGVATTRVKLIAFVLSAMIPALAGAIAALRSTFFEPMQMFNPMTSFTIVTMAMIGGSDKPAGPILGALLLTLLSELLWARAPEVYMIALGGLLLFFVFVMPEGLVGRLGRSVRKPAVSRSKARTELRTS
ncbi:branched-chain amino acid ABC transporter permease [Bordetella genomosp. 4]|uniref:Branched-chain amino acid ABC transporter permease n=1 Tax=Bordetella genomosp. 4 TaxID=463044 RepID=A0A261TUH7_9BORD|nr:branched-chain amino acid ABC transporter permease [Bordetella genomosp. 4]OZI52887.1 hypothetical protein CAL20_19685 [Bordetella genomosp. 4]